LLPDKDVDNGLVPLESQAIIRQMINASKFTKIVHVYVDHTGFLTNLRPDVILAPPAPPARSAASAALPPRQQAAIVAPPPTFQQPSAAAHPSF
jgi:hypothetical protein